MLEFSDWRKEHGKAIKDFLLFLNKKSDDYILKGGTSLMMCYELDRFSEDIDLDCTHSKSIKKIVSDFCTEKKYSFRIAKDTDTVKRFMINYGNDEKPLKIEVSYRRKFIDSDEIGKINGITVYNLDEVCQMKLNAYVSRDKIRDLYDVTFIVNNYFDKLSKATIKSVRNGIQYKGLEQFDYLIKQQHDELIDNDKLETDFLSLYDKLGLLVSESEIKLFETSNTQNISLSNRKSTLLSIDKLKHNAQVIDQKENSKKTNKVKIKNKGSQEL